MSDAVSDRSDRRRELLRARLRAEGFKQGSADQAANTQVGDSGTVTDQRILGRLIANAGAAGMLTWAFPIPEDAATQARIRDAIIAVAQHRPDLRTTVSADDTGGLQRTVLTADTVVTPSSDSAEPTEVDALAATPIDPTSEPPLRARFLHTPDGTMLVVSTHHVAADEHTWVLLLRDINAEIASPGVLSAQPTPPRSDATTAQVATATERRLTAVRPATHDVDGEPTPQPDPFAAERTTTANNTADRITLPAPQDWVQAVQDRAKADNTTVLSVLIDAAAVQQFAKNTRGGVNPTNGAAKQGADRLSFSRDKASETADGVRHYRGTVTVSARFNMVEVAVADPWLEPRDDGTWAVTLPANALPATGNATLSVTASDLAGNVSTPATQTLTIDTTPPPAPTIQFTGGADNYVNAAEKAAGVTLAGTAEADSTVKVTVGTVSHDAKAGADGKWSVAFAGAELPADGTHLVTAVATDKAGNASAPSAGTPMVVDTKPPVLTDTHAGGTDRVLSGVPFLITGKTEAGASVQVEFTLADGSKQVQNAVVTDTSPDSANWTLPNPIVALGNPIGAKQTTIHITATDKAGNISAVDHTFAIMSQSFPFGTAPAGSNTLSLKALTTGSEGDAIQKAQASTGDALSLPLAQTEPTLTPLPATASAAPSITPSSAQQLSLLLSQDELQQGLVHL